MSSTQRDHSRPSLYHQHRPGHTAGIPQCCHITILLGILRALLPLVSPFPFLALVSPSQSRDNHVTCFQGCFEGYDLSTCRTAMSMSYCSPLCHLPNHIFFFSFFSDEGLALSSKLWKPGQVAKAQAPGLSSSLPTPRHGPRVLLSRHTWPLPGAPGAVALGLAPPPLCGGRSWKFPRQVVSHCPFFSSRGGCAS